MEAFKTSKAEWDAKMALFESELPDDDEEIERLTALDKPLQPNQSSETSCDSDISSCSVSEHRRPEDATESAELMEIMEFFDEQSKQDEEQQEHSGFNLEDAQLDYDASYSERPMDGCDLEHPPYYAQPIPFPSSPNFWSPSSSSSAAEAPQLVIANGSGYQEPVSSTDHWPALDCCPPLHPISRSVSFWACNFYEDFLNTMLPCPDRNPALFAMHNAAYDRVDSRVFSDASLSFPEGATGCKVMPIPPGPGGRPPPGLKLRQCIWEYPQGAKGVYRMLFGPENTKMREVMSVEDYSKNAEGRNDDAEAHYPICHDVRTAADDEDECGEAEAANEELTDGDGGESDDGSVCKRRRFSRENGVTKTDDDGECRGAQKHRCVRRRPRKEATSTGIIQ